jgi:2-dehydrotetronate isomerase
MGQCLSAHIGYLFTELPLTARIAAARNAGFGAVEHPAPYGLDAQALGRLLKAEGLPFTQLASPSGDAQKGEKGLAALPGRESEFREGFYRALDYAEAVDCPFVHPMAGVTTAPDAGAVLADNIAFAVETCRHRKPKVLIEAISSAAVPGYVLDHPDKSVALATRFGGEVKILFDTFHAVACGIDPAAFVLRHGDMIGHVHIADHPGRHEPGTGQIDFDALRDALDETDFSGAIGFEFVPSRDTFSSLKWLGGWNRRQHSRNEELPA